MTDRKIYTNKEASEILRVSTVTLWRERRARRITYRIIGSKIVYLAADLEEYLERNKRSSKFRSK